MEVEHDWAAPFDAKEWARGHDRLCTERWKSSDYKLALIIKILFGLIATICAVAISFTGYTYVQSQTLAQQLALARSQQAAAIAAIPDKTAKAVGAIQGAPTSGN